MKSVTVDKHIVAFWFLFFIFLVGVLSLGFFPDLGFGYALISYSGAFLFLTAHSYNLDLLLSQ